MAEQMLLRRSFSRLRLGVSVSRAQRGRAARACRMSERRLVTRCLRRWRAVLVCTHALRCMAAASNAACATRAMLSWRAYTRSKRAKSAAKAQASCHARSCMQRRALRGWCAWVRDLQDAADPGAVTAAQAHAAQRLQSTLLRARAYDAWREYMEQHRRPRVLARRRSVRVHSRCVLRKAMQRWALYVALRHDKAHQRRWLSHRHDAAVLRGAFAAWGARAEHARRARMLLARAQRAHMGAAMRAWHAVAARARHLRLAVVQALRARGSYTRHAALDALRSHVAERRVRARKMRYALNMWRQRLLSAAFWPWLREAERGTRAAQQVRVLGTCRTMCSCTCRPF